MKLPPVAIIAGGLATRLYPITLSTPKSMIEIAGRPFIHYQLSVLKQNGVSNILLCVGNLGSQIQEYVNDGKAWGLEVEYSYDGQVPLGTGGAIKEGLSKLSEKFFVMYGDSYLNIDFKQVWMHFENSTKSALLVIYHNRDNFDRSNILIKNGKILEYKKEQSSGMEYIDYGLSIMNRRNFDDWPEGAAFDLGDVYRKLIASGDIVTFEAKPRFYEIGSKKGMQDTEKYLISKS